MWSWKHVKMALNVSCCGSLLPAERNDLDPSDCRQEGSHMQLQGEIKAIQWDWMHFVAATVPWQSHFVIVFSLWSCGNHLFHVSWYWGHCQPRVTYNMNSYRRVFNPGLGFFMSLTIDPTLSVVWQELNPFFGIKSNVTSWVENYHIRLESGDFSILGHEKVPPG